MKYRPRVDFKDARITHPREFLLYQGAYRRSLKGWCSFEFERSHQGFLNFIEEVGLIPDGMTIPTLGRKDHEQGYKPGNVFWQEKSENSKEARARYWSSKENRAKHSQFMLGNRYNRHCNK